MPAEKGTQAKFDAPYIHETPLDEIDDHEDYEQLWFCDHIKGVWRSFAFDTPEVMLPHSGHSETIEPGDVGWTADWEITDTLEKSIAERLGSTRQSKRYWGRTDATP